MHQKTTRASSLFLLELIAAIFFFCLASAVCIRFFVKSHSISEDTHNLDVAVNESASVAEIFRSEEDVLSFLKQHYPQGESNEPNSFTLYYDKSWNHCTPDSASFILSLQMKTEDKLCNATIIISDLIASKDIYTLDATKYMGEEDIP